MTVTRAKQMVQMGRHVFIEPIIGSRSDVPAAVGTKVLQHFAVTFDSRGRRVRLTRPADGPIRVPGSKSIGLTIGVRRRQGASEARASVDGVDPAGPASALGVAVGDLVISVEGRPGDELTDSDFRKLLQTCDALTFELERKGRRFIVAVPVQEYP